MLGGEAAMCSPITAARISRFMLSSASGSGFYFALHDCRCGLDPSCGLCEGNCCVSVKLRDPKLRVEGEGRLRIHMLIGLTKMYDV